MRLPRLLRTEEIKPVFNTLAQELELAIRPVVSGTATLAAGTTSTVVTDRGVGPLSAVLVVPADAAAAAEQDWYVEAEDVVRGQFTIRHGSAAGPRLVRYLLA